MLDHFIPKASITKVRQELVVMADNYEAGEIWVGKDADVGAQIRKAGVRGDVVLWMGQDALNAKQFVKDGRRVACCFHTMRALVAAVDQFIMHELPRCAEPTRFGSVESEV